ncbi:M48 family metallopeptidase [Desulfatibacillum aliphaticivorans]|uniref:M48 family metallopeptidase n=1 Tax=Desulfatibacillum aliphaticivorans TaxID=218208 RepID=UPI000160106D
MLNSYAWIILIFVLLDYALGAAAGVLNLKNIRDELPEEFADVWDKDRYAKSQQYLAATTRLGLVSSTVLLAVLLVFWFAGGFNFVDALARGLGFGPTLTGLAYFAFLAALSNMISTGFSLYSTFVIEERFGFNKTTLKTFILDRIKIAALACILGGPIIGGILYFLGHAGPNAWLYCWAGVTVFILFIQMVAPTWIMPLFNKFLPLENQELKQAVLDYTDSVDFPLENLFMMDGSKRSSKSNAFFAGFGKRRRIALFDTLIEKHTIPELVAVVAHEVGHYKKKHILTNMVISILHLGLMFYLLSLFISRQGLFDAFFMEQASVYAGLLFFGLLYAPVETILGLGLGMLSRKNEYEADLFSVTTTGDPQAMIDALKKLSRDNLSNLWPHPFYVFLAYSHPPVLERIRAIQQIEIH